MSAQPGFPGAAPDRPWPGWPAPVGPPPRPASSGALVDALLRGAGGGLALVGGVLTGVLVVLLVPLRVAHLGVLAQPLAPVAGWRLPVAPVVAVVAGGFLAWFARHATGFRWGPVLPAVGWFTVVVLALRTTTEGDRLLRPDDWLGALALFGGTLVLVVGVVLGLTTAGGAAARRPSPGRAGGRPW